jgi:hypothetical protein
MYKKIHVYDLDGTLLDSSHRYRNKPDGTIDLDYWLQNLDRCIFDSPLPLAEQYKADIADPETYVVICTMRPAEPQWMEHVRNTLGEPNKYLLGEHGLKVGFAGHKRKVLTRLFNLRQFKNLPRYFWEDSSGMIEATKHLFNRCFHVESNQNFVTE